ncbi:hypothetical protein RQN30_00290 [Arcanobacterium hippocoleae]
MPKITFAKSADHEIYAQTQILAVGVYKKTETTALLLRVFVISQQL